MQENLLPYHGEVFYSQLLDSNQSEIFFNQLINKTMWSHDVNFIFGKRIVTKRKVAWYGDSPFVYTYSNESKMAMPWIDPIFKLKSITERATRESYNSCLLNLYHNGDEGMGWHSDNEKELKENGAIASISLGAERKFLFKHKSTDHKVDLFLENGSILLMKGEIQKYWKHRLPPTKKINTARINLTFRTIIT